MKELVSVIIPTYKGANCLSRAIDSVLNQTYKFIEIIIVDDNEPASADRMETKKVVNHYKSSNIKYLQHTKNMRGAVARNTGINHSSGEYICFLDDDDFYLPDRIEQSVRTLKNNSEFNAAYCSVVLVRNNNINGVVKADKPLTQKDILMNEMTFGTGSNIFVSRNVIEKLNGFDENFLRHQDLEFMVRVVNYFRVINIPDSLIVKATNGNDNLPNYVGLERTKKLYFEKFQSEINKLEEEERKSFYSNQYQTLVHSAIMSRNDMYVKKSLNYLNIYKQRTLKYKLIVFLITKKIINKRTLDFMKHEHRKLKQVLISLNLKKLDLDKETIKKIQGILKNSR